MTKYEIYLRDREKLVVNVEAINIREYLEGDITELPIRIFELCKKFGYISGEQSKSIHYTGIFTDEECPFDDVCSNIFEVRTYEYETYEAYSERCDEANNVKLEKINNLVRIIDNAEFLTSEQKNSIIYDIEEIKRTI